MPMDAGDLKSKNVLLTKNAATAKLSDVGMSRVLATTINNFPLVFVLIIQGLKITKVKNACNLL